TGLVVPADRPRIGDPPTARTASQNRPKRPSARRRGRESKPAKARLGADWGKLIGDVPAATAILNRFLHHAEVVTLSGRSYRLRNQARAAQEAAAAESKPAKAPLGAEDGNGHIADAGERMSRRFLEFFTANIRNPNTPVPTCGRS